MDFHSLARRDLQAMCKNNKIPANLTNAAMADALQSLKSIEWVEEIKQKLMPQSEPFEQHGSPLPRSRRVAAISSDDISGFSMGEINDKEEEMKKEALIEANQTPSTAVRRSRRIQSSMSARTREGTSTAVAGMGSCTAGTRTRKGKKEEAPAETVDSVVVATPAPQRGRRKAVETPSQSVVPRSSARPTGMGTCTGTRTRKGKKEEAPAEAVDTLVVETPAPQRGRRLAGETPTQGVVPRSSARPTRQSTRRLAESTGTRVTRTLTKLALDPAGDKEAETDVIELGRTTEPKPADKLEVEEVADQNQVNEVSKEPEQAEVAEEQTEDVDLVKEDELVSDEKLNLVEHHADQIEIPQEKSITDTEESTHEELSTKTSEQKEILTEVEAVEEQLNSNVSEEEKDNVSIDKLAGEENAALISEEGLVAPEKDESEVNQTTLTDSPIMGLVSEIIQANNSDLQNAPSSDISILDVQNAPSSDITTLDLQNALSSDISILDLQNAPSSDIITLDLQNAPSGLCLSSPIRAPADEGVEKMLDSVVRHFANAQLSSNTKMIDASVVQKEVIDKVVSEDGSELVQNENADKESVDLKNMSLRKLKALYKDRLNEMNSKKIVEDDGKRLPLGKLDENLLI